MFDKFSFGIIFVMCGAIVHKTSISASLLPRSDFRSYSKNDNKQAYNNFDKLEPNKVANAIDVVVQRLTEVKAKTSENEYSGNALNKCCIPLSWEGLLYLDFGTVFIDQNTAFAYMNGSVHAAYSFPKKKVFFNITGVEQSPLIPKPVPDDSLLLYDFEGKMMYTVSNGECQKSALESNMTHQCIPNAAKEISTGVYKSGNTTRILRSYQFSTDIDIPYDITATVYKNDLTPIEPKTCFPLYVHYFTPSGNPDSGSMYGLTFMDIGPIQSETIFDVPEACK